MKKTSKKALKIISVIIVAVSVLTLLLCNFKKSKPKNEGLKILIDESVKNLD